MTSHNLPFIPQNATMKVCASLTQSTNDKKWKLDPPCRTKEKTLNEVECLETTIEEKKIYISVSGPIAAGKTTFCKNLSDILQIPIYHEEVDNNPYLAPFYEDQKTWAFRLQIYFLASRYKQQQTILSSLKELGVIGIIQDRTIYEDPVFAKVLKKDGSFTETDFQTYQSLFDVMMDTISVPDVIVFLRASSEMCLSRIKQR